MDHRPDLISWYNGSFSFNTSAANTSDDQALFLSPIIDKTISIIMIVVLFVIMVSLGCTMELFKIKHHLLKPKGVAIAVLAQYGIMPLTAFCLAKAFQLTEIKVVVVLICGCCPGGTLSNILALALQGDMNLSIVMTTCSTLLALGMMPLLLYIYCQGFPDLQSAVPYAGIMKSLVMILVPCGVGIILNYYRPQYSKTIMKVGMVTLLIAAVVIVTLAGMERRDSLLTLVSPQLLAIGALMPLIGYSFGYIVSSLFRLTQQEQRTVAMETGCQNTQLCLNVLKLAFPPAVIGPLFLFPMVYLFFQLTEAMAFIVAFRCYQRFTRKQKEPYQPTSTEDRQKGPSEGVASRTDLNATCSESLPTNMSPD